MKTFTKYASLVMAGLAGLAVLMIFAPQLKSDGVLEWNGLDIVFGCKESFGLGTSLTCFEFSFVNCLTYVCLILSCILSFVYYKNNDKKFLIVAIICAFVSSLFFFLCKEFVVLNPTVEDLLLAEGIKFKDYTDPAIGAICGGLLSLATSVIGIVKLNIDKQ